MWWVFFPKLTAPDGKQRDTDAANTETLFRIIQSIPSPKAELDKVKTGNNLRDHMTDLELIFTMLGEAGTTEIARRKEAKGFADNRTAAKEGGTIAGDARKALEAKSGKPVVSKANYLAPPVAAALENVDAAAPPAKRKAATRPKKSMA
ncbi:MAG: hypothetical protein Q8O38_02675 [Sulfurimicrobium sp.]|nr:hypothetical protein [Sulfurimicrobium sp.]